MQLKADSLKSIIKAGIDGDVVIIGFPFHIGAKREDLLPLGQDHGPDCFRRFLNRCGPLENAEYDLIINNVTISDYGNILADKFDLEKNLSKLATKVSLITDKKGIPFTFGGTKDLKFGVVSGLFSKKSKGIAICDISSFLDVKNLFDFNKISCLSSTRFLIKEYKEQIANNKIEFFNFGHQAENLEKYDKDFVDLNKEIYHIFGMKEVRRFNYIRNYEQDVDFNEPITQFGVYLAEKMKEIESLFDQIYFSISLEAINSCYAPGVSNPNVIGGLSSEEIIEVLFILGKSKNVVGVDICDYNPNVEDFRTGTLLAKMFYYFVMGYSIRKAKKDNLG